MPHLLWLLQWCLPGEWQYIVYKCPSPTVKERERLILDPHWNPNQLQNWITSRGSPLAHAYHVWLTSINTFSSYPAHRERTINLLHQPLQSNYVQKHFKVLQFSYGLRQTTAHQCTAAWISQLFLFKHLRIAYCNCSNKKTRGQSNLTKSASRGAIPQLGVTPGDRNLYHWIPGVGFPISVP